MTDIRKQVYSRCRRKPPLVSCLVALHVICCCYKMSPLYPLLGFVDLELLSAHRNEGYIIVL
jgi:hypothetical protein